MKRLSLLLVFVSSQAFAFPTVGDWATFSNVKKDHGVTTTQTQKLEIASYDAGTDSYVLRTTDTVDGVSTTKDESVPSSHWVPQAQDQQELRDCFWHDIGGTPDFVTVPAGTMYSCRFSHTERKDHTTVTAWLADAPFAYVKVVTCQPDFSEVREMTAFGRGQ